MKNNIVLVLMISMGVAFAPAAALSADENAFHEGTRFTPLTDQQKETLRAYVESARARLAEALETAKGKGFEAANAIYLSAIRLFVLESFKDKERSQLLMRMALNQALQLTFGIPTSDGKKVEEPGFLLGIANPELLTVILEESIQISLQYLVEDLKAIDAKKLVDLPYDKFAHSRLQLARKWLASTLDLRGAYVLSVVSLAHWLSTMNQKEQLHLPLYAEELDKVDTELRNAGVSVGVSGKIDFSVPQDLQALAGKVRVFRGVVRKLDERLQKKTSVQALSLPAPVVNKGEKTSPFDAVTVPGATSGLPLCVIQGYSRQSEKFASQNFHIRKGKNGIYLASFHYYSEIVKYLKKMEKLKICSFPKGLQMILLPYGQVSSEHSSVNFRIHIYNGATPDPQIGFSYLCDVQETIGLLQKQGLISVKSQGKCELAGSGRLTSVHSVANFLVTIGGLPFIAANYIDDAIGYINVFKGMGVCD